MAMDFGNNITQVQTNQTQVNTDNSSKVDYTDSSSTRTLIDNKVDNSSRTHTDNSSKFDYTDNSSTRTLIDNKVDNSSKWSYNDTSSFNYDSSVKETYTDNSNNSVNNTYTDNSNNSVNTSYTDNSNVDNSVNNIDNSRTYTDNSDHSSVYTDNSDNSSTYTDNSDNSDHSTTNYSFENITGPVFFQSSVSGGVGNTSISGGVGNTYVDNSRTSYTDNSVNNIDNSVTTITDNSVTDNSTNVVSQGNAFVYSGGDQVIDNYQSGDKIKLASDYQGIGLEGNSFFVKSSSGQLEIQNSRDKFIEYTGENEETVAYTYVASGEGAVDGRGKSQAEIMIGGDDSNNQMYAGEGASSLWGGNGGADTLVGGDGYTEFFYAVGSGNDVVQNSVSTDIVNLLGVSLEQITNVDVNIGQVNINFMDGGSLKVEGNTGVGYKLGDQVYTVNQSTGEWSTK